MRYQKRGKFHWEFQVSKLLVDFSSRGVDVFGNSDHNQNTTGLFWVLTSYPTAGSGVRSCVSIAVVDGRSRSLLQQGAPLRAVTALAYSFDMAATIFDIFHIFL